MPNFKPYNFAGLLIGATLALTGCKDHAEQTQAARGAMEANTDTLSAIAMVDSAALRAALDAQPDDIKARYAYRNPEATLTAIGLEPGMTVVDALPGAEGKGWYTGILAHYLGSGDETAKLIGVDYSLDMWPEFGGFADAAFLEAKKTWASDWVTGAEARKAAGDFGNADIEFAATTFGGANGPYAGQADAVLFMRALHNLSRFEGVGGYLSEAVDETFDMLKPGGIVGIVQHRAPADADEEWARGSNGYIKQADVIEAFEAAGFELVTTSEVNANSKDQPTSEDAVWRLPPTLGTSREDAGLKAQMEAIGESDRMTLVFRKPS